MRKSILVCASIASLFLAIGVAWALSIDSSSGVTNPSYSLDGNNSTGALASDASACPAGWSVSSGKCVLGSYSIEGWILMENTECKPLIVRHAADCNPLNCGGTGHFYVFGGNSSNEWTYMGEDSDQAIVETTTFNTPNFPITQYLVGRHSDLSGKKNVYWYEFTLGTYSNSCI